MTQPPAPGDQPALALRAAEARDLEAIVDIERAAFSDPWSALAFRSAMRSPAGCVLVAERAGRVVGYAVVLQAADESELANLAVAAETRGAGVGRALLLAARAAAVSRGASTMFLEVRESNVPARALYAGAGFAVVGRRRGYYRAPDEDALIMRWSADRPGSPAA